MFQCAVFGQRAVFDWHGKPSWKWVPVCMRELTLEAFHVRWPPNLRFDWNHTVSKYYSWQFKTCLFSFWIYGTLLSPSMDIIYEFELQWIAVPGLLIYISCGSCGLLKSKPREGGRAASPHRGSRCFFSLLSSRLISEYLISIMSDPSPSLQGSTNYILNLKNCILQFT